MGSDTPLKPQTQTHAGKPTSRLSCHGAIQGCVAGLERRLLPLSFLLVWDQLPSHSQCEQGERGKADPLFPCMACNELGQPLMGSLTGATRRNRSPAGRWAKQAA